MGVICWLFAGLGACVPSVLPSFLAGEGSVLASFLLKEDIFVLSIVCLHFVRT
jgi:hypothetical protein